jgi:hypothetical protein
MTRFWLVTIVACALILPTVQTWAGDSQANPPVHVYKAPG